MDEKTEKKPFGYVIGNPPYQEDTKDTSDKPVYNFFMDGAYSVADKVMLIHPARFLFNAGKTPKAWNEKMLADPHLKVEHYEQDSSKVFPGTDIKGGIAVTYRDALRDFGEIGAFSTHQELNSILHKVASHKNFAPLDDIIVQQNRWNLSVLLSDFPQYREKIGSNGTERRLTTPIFSSLDIFKDSESDGDIQIIGLIKNRRYYKYVPTKYIDTNHENLYKFKALLPASTASGALGEVLSSPIVGKPCLGYTQSFIGFGAFDTIDEASAVCKYIKTKFARTLLGILKVTQHNHKGVWRYVPVQDFTGNSDIDWSVSIAEIDRRLYRKYGIEEKEIEFIETHVKEMA